jgi:hypothetical protein
MLRAMSLAASLMTASAAIVFALGTAHLVYTFFGPKFHARDPALTQRMKEVSPVISGDTTMWKAWVSFNATHSMGAMLFGLVFGGFALIDPAYLFGARWLLAIGAAMLAGFVLLGARYWFSVPFRGSAFAFALYLASIALR